MKHPFDDFMPQSWHNQRADRRVIRIGVILVAVVSIATAAAFATTLTGWRSILKDMGSVNAHWDEAKTRVNSYVHVQKEIKDAIEEVNVIEQLTDGIPRSILLWELTQQLPEQTYLEDVRLETRRLVTENEEIVRTETITLLGIAPNDSSITAYIDQLSTSSCFTDISILYAQLDSNGINRNFSIQMKVVSLEQLALGTIE
ncbi:MAG: PilN domain-containing protein [Phycisphaerales bacterium]|jgi:Tfp pilus assembly protein PilN|nr:PilN domain-containing protein [Phycisphaerales bacterium]